MGYLRFVLSGKAVQGIINVQNVSGDHSRVAAVNRLMVSILRHIPTAEIAGFIKTLEAVQTVGPLVNPDAWGSRQERLEHSAGIDVLRRLEDFRRAIAEYEATTGKRINNVDLEITDNV